MVFEREVDSIGQDAKRLKADFGFPRNQGTGNQGGRQDLQRFIYWNFIKCFWNEELGHEASVSGNFDWYAPSLAFRYTQEEFLEMSDDAGFENLYLHCEEACHTGRFRAI